MNILIAADYATPASGNFIASVFELGKALEKDNHKLFFIFPESPNTLSDSSWVHWLENEGFKVYLTNHKNDEAALTFLQEIIDKNNIDILHLHFGMFHRIILNNAKALGVKIFVHDHMEFNPKVSLTQQKIYCAVTSLKYRINKISVVSVNERKCKAYLFAKRFFIPNGISFKRNVTTFATREETRKKLGLKDNQKLCLLLGWHLHTKGIDIAFKAVEKLSKSNRDVVLGIVGHSGIPSENSLNSIKEFTGVDPHSSFIKFFESAEDLFAYHKASDVFLSASRSEAFSYGVLEAISQNTPLVMSDITGTGWAHSYNKAFVYPTEDYSACANAIEQALQLDRNAPSNSDEFIEKYSIENWCTAIKNVYKIN